MTDSKLPVTDVLGLAPYGKAVDRATKGLVDGAGAFLSRVCLPAAEEVGLLLKDRVSHWRAENAARVACEAETKLRQAGASEDVKIPPKLAYRVLDAASWVDDSHVQDLWSGLLASAASSDGVDDSNLLFIGMLENLSGVQAKILEFACAEASKAATREGLMMAGRLTVTPVALQRISACDDIHRLDRELDQLRNLGLLGELGGFQVPYGPHIADITPSSLGLQMMCRCKGSKLTPPVFYACKQLDDGITIEHKRFEK